MRSSVKKKMAAQGESRSQKIQIEYSPVATSESVPAGCDDVIAQR